MQKSGVYRVLLLLAIIAALFAVMQYFGLFDYLVPIRLANVRMNYWFLLIFGLITSVHCIAVCGSINISQCQPKTVLPSILYNAGRITSYTLAGTIFGAVGSVFNFTMGEVGIFKMIAGFLIFLMGLKILNLVPKFRIFSLKKNRLFDKLSQGRSPYIVGVLNWLMPCGPLQAAHLYAFSTGSPFYGGLSMLLFVLGTIPLKFGLGLLGSVAEKDISQKIMIASGVMAAVIGLCMLAQGITGIKLD